MSEKEARAYVEVDGKKIPITTELERDVFTEHSLQLALFKEVQYRLYFAARAAIEHAKKESSFLNGAYLRIILDSASEVLMLTCMGQATQKRFITHWKEGKPINKFKIILENGETTFLTTGFIRKSIPIFNELYEALNPHIHPSLMYYQRVVNLNDDTLFINQDVPTEDLTGLEGRVFGVFETAIERYNEMVDILSIPKSNEYRVLKYSDSLMEYLGKEPVEIKVYKE